MAGITDPPNVAIKQFFIRWLQASRASSVELMCHPGYRDETLIGTIVLPMMSALHAAHEINLLRAADFSTAALRAGFRLRPRPRCQNGDATRRPREFGRFYASFVSGCPCPTRYPS